MSVSIEQKIQEPESPEANEKGSSLSLEPTPLRTGMLDDWLMEDSSAADPLEYIMMDTLSHLPAGSADKLLKSLQRSAQRAQRAERLVLRLKSHLEGQDSERLSTSPSAPSKASDAHTDSRWQQISYLWVLFPIVIVAIALLVFKARHGTNTLALTPHDACKPCATTLNQTSNSTSVTEINSSIEHLTLELESLHAMQAECQAGAQQIREKWRLAAQRTPPLCTSAQAKRGASPNRETDSARVAALATISEQQGRIAQLQGTVDGLQGERSRCAKCLASHGVMADCSEALQEAAVIGL